MPSSFAEQRKALKGLLQFAAKLFPYLIERLEDDVRPRFRTAWQEEVEPQLAATQAQIEGITTPQAPLWTRLTTAGVTGGNWDLKRYLLSASAKDGLLRRFLRLLNSLLDSLDIPGTHAIKEFLDLIEEFLPESDEPDKGFKGLFGKGGFVPFGLPDQKAKTRGRKTRA